MNFNIVTVDASNVDEHGFFCVKNQKHPGHIAKRSWLGDRFAEGLRMKLLITPENKQAGFIEYTPGESSWRIVEAAGYLVIHCLWVNSKQFEYKGMASALLAACVDEASSTGKLGVAVVTSDGPWMAGKDVYIKNDFVQVDEAEPYYQLLVRKTSEGANPSFPTNWEERLEPLDKLQLLYTNQCPYIGKAVKELPPVAEQHGVELEMIEFIDSAEARARMPSPYGTFCLVGDGRLLVDHPISATRFRNILQRTLKLKPVA